MVPRAPAFLKEEYQRLTVLVRRAIALGGETGKQAERLANLLLPHLEREATLALPLLGFLRNLATAEAPSHGDEARTLAAQFRRAYPGMLVDHAQIAALAGHLQQAAAQEGHAEVEALTRSLGCHAHLSEEVLYPAALLLTQVLEQAPRQPRPHVAR